MTFLAPADQARIEAAIAEGERRTSGEIVCTFDAGRHVYREWVLALAAAAAFLLPLAAARAGFGPSFWLAAVPGWQGGAPGEAGLLEIHALMQGMVLLLATALLWRSPLAGRHAPLALRRARARDMAMRQFLALGVHLTEARTGVLIHVSAQDHVVEVIADEAIYRRVPPQHWAAAAEALASGLKAGDPARGFIDAITLAADVLAAHFPPAAADRNELPNRLRIL